MSSTAVPRATGATLSRQSAPIVATLLSTVLLATSAGTARAQASAPPPASDHYWRRFAAGFVSSILAHEAAHLGASLVMHRTPTFGFDAGRPTIYSGIVAADEPRKQFTFSAAGMTAQSVLDEGVLDVPHRRGGAFERGVLTGGIATVVFYGTLGRSASVSDVTLMARTSNLSKTEVSLIFGAVAALHAVRISRDGAYAHFFVRPAAAAPISGRSVGGSRAGLLLGVRLSPSP
jgi:hypothetical protein